MEVSHDPPGPLDVNFYLWNKCVVWICGEVPEFHHEAKTLYVQPDTMLNIDAKTVMVRPMRNTTMLVVMQYVLRLWRMQGSIVEKPQLTFTGAEINSDKMTSDFKDGDTVLIQSIDGPRFPHTHSGKLWTCTCCGYGRARLEKLKKCHKTCPPEGIKMLNSRGKQIQPNSWGQHKKVKNNKPAFAPLEGTEPFSFGIPSNLPPKAVIPSHLPHVEVLQKPPSAMSGMTVVVQNKAGRGKWKKHKRDKSVNQIAPTLVSLEEKGTKIKRSKMVKYAGMDTEDIEDSSDEWEAGTTDLEESDEVTERENITRKRLKKWTTDDEEDSDRDSHDEEIDEEETERRELYEQDRTSNKAKRRQDIWEAVLEGRDMSQEYVPDEADEAFMLKFKGYVQSKSGKRNACAGEISEKNLEELDKGGDLSGTDKAAQSRTATEYKRCLGKLLGYIQAEMNDHQPGVLKEGRIHLRNFFNFNSEDYIEYRNVVGIITKYEPALSNKGQQLGAYTNLGKMVAQHLDEMPAVQCFSDPNIEDPKERFDDAQRKADELQRRITGKLAIMKEMDMYKRWKQLLDASGKKLNEYHEEFHQDVNYDPMEMIKTFYRSDDVKNLISAMADLSDKINGDEDLDVAPSFILEMNEIVPCMIVLTAGNRAELFGNLTRGSFETAVPNQSNPNKPLHLNATVRNDPRVKDRLHDGAYINPDPSKIDPLDPDPPQNHPGWKEGWLPGWTMKASLHKTSFKYILYVFLSKVDHFILRMYQDITVKFLESKGVEVTHKTPLFVSLKGERLISEKRPANFKRMREITGCTKLNTGTFRHLLSTTIYNTNDAQLIQLESVAAGHAPTTAKDKYVHSSYDRMANMYLQSEYRKIIGLGEDLPREGLELQLVRGEAQQKTSLKFRSQVMQSKKDDMLYTREKADQTKKAIPTRTITESAKVAFFKLVNECDSSHRHVLPVCSKSTDVCKLFFSGKISVWDKSLNKTILRMLDTCPRNSLPRMELEAHMVLRSRIKSDTVDKTVPEKALRRLELECTQSLLKFLDNLRISKTAKAVTNQVMLEELEKIAIRKKSDQFCLGSEGIRTLVRVSLVNSERIEKELNIDRTKLTKVTHKQLLTELKTVRKLDQVDDDDDEEHDNDEDSDAEIEITTKYDMDVETPEGQVIAISPGKVKFKKVKNKDRVEWDDRMKTYMLRLYVQQAEDPLVRAPTLMGRACYRRQLVDIWKEATIIHKGNELRVKEIITLNSLAVHFSIAGLNGQKAWGKNKTGLVHIIDKVMKNLPVKTVEIVREREDQIIELAMELANK